ncbi:response regulator [Selenomonas sp. TAMA-11512]|uniref:response regulator n=1 Tax=Selenomonas sp. TAMA-11512 TaxID=3095337 RepID=UPI0030D55B8E
MNVLEKVKIMIVDDSRVSQAMLEGILSKTEFEVVALAGNVAEAVERYKEFQPDAVTMDMNLPDGSGLDASRRIIEFDPNAKIVMISAMRDVSLMTRGREVGIHSFLQKPVKPQALMDTLMVLCHDKIGTASILRESYVRTFAQAMQRSLQNLINMESEITITESESNYLTVQGIAVILGLTGYPMGRIVVHMEKPVMKAFAHTMLVKEVGVELSEDEVNDAIEEASNIIAGRGVSKVNDIFRDREIRLTPPGTISGSGIRIANPKLTSFEVKATTKIGDIYMNIGFAEGA